MSTRVAPETGGPRAAGAALGRGTPWPQASRAARLRAYARATQPRPIDLHLDANEGSPPDATWLESAWREAAATVHGYPDPSEFERLVAARAGVDPARVVVTAGADDALARIVQATIEAGREAVLTTPTFEMIGRYVALAGGTARAVPWPDGPFPAAAVCAAIGERTACVFIVSPNNPTGCVAAPAALRAVCSAARAVGALVVLDAAYEEFAEADAAGLSAAALAEGGVALTRTMSKAWGLAGLRVGWAIMPDAALAQVVRAVGQPYAVSGPSLCVAARSVHEREPAMRSGAARVAVERGRLTEALDSLGARPTTSRANCVLARCGTPARGAWLADALAALGIAARRYDAPAGAPLTGCVRITCPGASDERVVQRVETGLRAALAPQCLLFDLDGVLADVSGSYRAAILAAAACFGVALERADIAKAKAAGDANNDWVLTQRLLGQRGVRVPQERVTAAFEEAYQGTATRPGLRSTERLLLTRDGLAALRARLPLGIVTGRPRADAERFLCEQGVADLFACVVCMEDAPAKPRPDAVHLALARLGAATGWMLGDTVDDVRAARATGAVVPIGVCAPGDTFADADRVLTGAGAARVLSAAGDVHRLLDEALTCGVEA